MDTQLPTSSFPSGTSNSEKNQTEIFSPDSVLIYGLHGKCRLVAVESKQIGSETIPFYKLEILKSNLSRSNRIEPAIWVPLKTATERGLRKPLSAEQTPEIFAILSSREYYFPLEESWGTVLPKLEKAIEMEGAAGLAKVVSYLFVLKRKQVVPASQVAKFHETTSRLLFRELSEALNEPVRAIEEKVNKGFRHKLLPDH